jgi:excisionase family DNA binding protein
MAPNPLALPMLLTVRETAELLRTTDKAIYTMVERAQLPGVTRVGRRVLVRSAELLRWLDHNSAPSPGILTRHSAVPIQSPAPTSRKQSK